jgi:ferric-dicitrate binding protein FerR (iron transport regulator)
VGRPFPVGGAQFTRVSVLNRTPNAFDTEETAAAWLVRLDVDTSEATLASWQQWLREDARHRAAFVRVEQGWRQAECLKSLRPLDGVVRADLLDAFPEMGRSEAASAGPSGGSGSPRMSSGFGLSRWLGPRRRLGLRRWLGLSRAPPYSTLAVALGASAVTCLLVLAGWRFLMQPDHRVHQTERGGFERVVLPDGSTASLNTNSEIRVHFTHHQREIVLTRGEALFSVARDELRPFEVDAGANAVRALGTSFAVRLRPAGKVEVLVLQGEVAVDDPRSAGARSVFSSGDDAMIDADGEPQIERVDAPGIEHKLAWAHGTDVIQLVASRPVGASR